MKKNILGENRKEGKMKRKMAMAKDRSKYKKTDQEKYLKSVEKDKEAKLSKQDWLKGAYCRLCLKELLLIGKGKS